MRYLSSVSSIKMAVLILLLLLQLIKGNMITQSIHNNHFNKDESKQTYIVILESSYSHNHFEDFMTQHVFSRSKQQVMKVHHRYSHVMHGLAVSGVTELHIRAHPGVIRIIKDNYYFKRSPVSSGSVDGFKHPLDLTSPDFTGKGVDIYIIDSGIDTNHIEFGPNTSGRIVRNIRLEDGSETDEDTDLIGGNFAGHGTHTAGIAGGNTIGVSPHANLYGIATFGPTGTASLSDNLKALDIVCRRHALSSSRVVVNLSFGYQCVDGTCENDEFIPAVEALINRGIIVVIAAGNDASNACFYSPAAAQNAITVGFYDSSTADSRMRLSNFGQCIDVFAPGYNINSACASSVCGAENLYSLATGSSEAAPFVAGIAAQLLEKYPLASPAEITQAISCAALRDKLTPNGYLDTVTKNLIVQIPRIADPMTCDLGAGCPSSCSGAGLCSVALLGFITTDLVNTDLICRCDAGLDGNSCENVQEYGVNNLEIMMSDIAGSDDYEYAKKSSTSRGWRGSRFGLMDSNNKVVSNMIDTMRAIYDNGTTQREFNVPPGQYFINVTTGSGNLNVGWSLCGYLGGAPLLSALSITGPNQCEIDCMFAKVPLFIYASTAASNVINIYSQSDMNLKYSVQLPGGADLSQNLCLQDGLYVVRILAIQTFSLTQFTICGVHASSASIIEFAITNSMCISAIEINRCGSDQIRLNDNTCSNCPEDSIPGPGYRSCMKKFPVSTFVISQLVDGVIQYLNYRLGESSGIYFAQELSPFTLWSYNKDTLSLEAASFEDKCLSEDLKNNGSVGSFLFLADCNSVDIREKTFINIEDSLSNPYRRATCVGRFELSPNVSFAQYQTCFSNTPLQSYSLTTTCPAGAYLSEDGISCVRCAANSFSNIYGSISSNDCVLCPSGLISPEGSFSIDQCTLPVKPSRHPTWRRKRTKSPKTSQPTRPTPSPSRRPWTRRPKVSYQPRSVPFDWVFYYA